MLRLILVNYFCICGFYWPPFLPNWPQSFLPLIFPHGNFQITIAHSHFELTPLQICPFFPPLIFPHANFQFTIDPHPSSTSNWPLFSPHPHTPRQFSNQSCTTILYPQSTISFPHTYSLIKWQFTKCSSLFFPVRSLFFCAILLNHFKYVYFFE
ncbi:uncharacterized protein Gasu_15650 [Galdieria sulphuraria]|uniref:Uncharacterized protein n=1 Tax=Galdieria sulphuraria TaxID=130081 RepID=M2Y509_GALSU|nr:uncharacterized protein Gasu_15650 [Galdieria sulphuraria]EME31058.1 hypothetical protein Gasu_15650 [Galdieria sulphuraria]|eukprot:XP_005707578.1 hypothetical protein Gasu_15650 [Galdieria sulphuraria]